jgi:hypothetical protein
MKVLQNQKIFLKTILIKMNNTTGYYGIVFSHGEIHGKERVKNQDRYTNAKALRQSDMKFIPIFMFGTTGAGSYYSKTIVCFHIFANIHGTEFCDAVAEALLKYGDKYMKRYKLPPNPTLIDKAVEYLFRLNKDELETFPQNRFFTYYSPDQKPYNLTLTKHQLNESVVSNIPFPTYKLSTNRFYTITDFYQATIFNTETFIKNNETNFPTISQFVGQEEIEFTESNAVQPFMIFDNYEYEFGICKVINIFSILSMGLFVSKLSTNTEQIDDHTVLLGEIIGDITLSDVMKYFQQLDRNDVGEPFECRGVFTFCCKSINPAFVGEDQVLQLQQQHLRQGLLPFSQQQLKIFQQQQQQEKRKNQARKLVKKALKK